MNRNPNLRYPIKKAITALGGINRVELSKCKKASKDIWNITMFKIFCFNLRWQLIFSNSDTRLEKSCRYFKDLVWG